MSPEAQRIAIGERHGWKLVMDDPLYEPYWEDPKGNKIGVSCGMRCPDYLTDLNALAAARDQVINTLELRIKWVNTLRTVVGKTTINRNKLGNPIVSDIDLLFAKPEQLAETLLRTLNLWKS